MGVVLRATVNSLAVAGSQIQVIGLANVNPLPVTKSIILSLNAGDVLSIQFGNVANCGVNPTTALNITIPSTTIEIQRLS